MTAFIVLHQSYCWQVALQQRLLPLQIDKSKINIILTLKPTVFYHNALFSQNPVVFFSFGLGSSQMP
jgi:hypothetical protein